MRPVLTPRTRAAHRELGNTVDVLLDVVLEHAPRSVALTWVAECLASMADEHREWAATCADSEAYEDAQFTRWYDAEVPHA